MRTVLVTGGAGFIGSHLVQSLCARGDHVRVLDDLSTGREQNLEGLDVELCVGDIRDQGAVQEAVAGAELVFHLAAMVSVPVSMENPLHCYDVNVNGTLNVLWEAYNVGVERVVLASSCAVYGDTSKVSGETDPVKPLSPYAGSKMAAENVATMFNRTYRLPTVSLRFFNVYGPGQRVDSPYAAVIPIFVDALLSSSPPTIYGDGHQTRDFVFVSDVVRANLLAADVENPFGEVYNIAGPSSISILKLFEILQDIIPNSPEVNFAPTRDGDVMHSRADKKQAQAALGYRPEIALEQGLQHTVQWYKSEGGKLG
jgi:UDP-glucose 4-epimerase